MFNLARFSFGFTLPFISKKIMANAFQILNAEYVEVVIPTGNQKQTIYFPDLPNLRNKPIMGIEAYCNREQQFTISGSQVQDFFSLHDATITLYYEGGEYIVVPINSIKRLSISSNFGTFGDIPNLAGQNIVWTKSYVSMNANLNQFEGRSFLFNVYYKR